MELVAFCVTKCQEVPIRLEQIWPSVFFAFLDLPRQNRNPTNMASFLITRSHLKYELHLKKNLPYKSKTKTRMVYARFKGANASPSASPNKKWATV